jgi:CheY-like chemotaxis protein
MHSNGTRPRSIVLVVDDNPMCRTMIAEVLRNSGASVLVATNGYQAIGILSRRSPEIDLLIVDTEMPGVHGWEVIRFARTQVRKMRVLRLGRLEDTAPGPEYETFSALPSLAKPFTSARLLETMRQRFKLPVMSGCLGWERPGTPRGGK